MIPIIHKVIKLYYYTLTAEYTLKKLVNANEKPSEEYFITFQDPTTKENLYFRLGASNDSYYIEEYLT